MFQCLKTWNRCRIKCRDRQSCLSSFRGTRSYFHFKSLFRFLYLHQYVHNRNWLICSRVHYRGRKIVGFVSEGLRAPPLASFRSRETRYGERCSMRDPFEIQLCARPIFRVRQCHTYERLLRILRRTFINRSCGTFINASYAGALQLQLQRQRLQRARRRRLLARTSVFKSAIKRLCN